MASVDNAKNESLAPAEGPGTSAGAVLVFLFTSVLVFGGFYVMSLAFGASDVMATLLFTGALLMETLGFWIAFRGFSKRSK